MSEKVRRIQDRASKRRRHEWTVLILYALSENEVARAMRDPKVQVNLDHENRRSVVGPVCTRCGKHAKEVLGKPCEAEIPADVDAQGLASVRAMMKLGYSEGRARGDHPG